MDAGAAARSAIEEKFERAYMLKDTAPAEALALFEQVVAETPPDDLYHLKAQAHVTALRP